MSEPVRIDAGCAFLILFGLVMALATCADVAGRIHIEIKSKSDTAAVRS